MDELALSGPSEVAEVRDGVVRRVYGDAGGVWVDERAVETLQGGDAETNAGILRAVFAGEGGPRRDVVVMNAAAVLAAAGVAADVQSGVGVAAEAIDSGAVTELVARLAVSGRA